MKNYIFITIFVVISIVALINRMKKSKQNSDKKLEILKQIQHK